MIPATTQKPENATERRKLGRVAAASSIGATIEWYDFFVYGTASALVFPQVFFPGFDASVGVIASFATFAIAFLSRPLGALFFGHFGDRIGRKRTLVWTLLIMGVTAMTIGIMPGYATGAFGLFESGIGLLAPTLLVLLRFLQGFAVGGEAGSLLLTAEYAPEGRRGRMAIFPQLGPAAALFLASGTFWIAFVTVGADSTAFLTYGWRIPFIASFLLIVVGLWVRVAVEETPVFVERQKLSDVSSHQRPPFVEAARVQWREIVTAGLSLTVFFAMFYMGSAFLTNYGSGVLGFGIDFILVAGMIGAVALAVATVVAAIISDRLGRRRMILGSALACIPWSLALFPVLNTGSPAAFLFAVSTTLVLFGVAYGPTGALLPELFAARFRYTGAGLVTSLAGILGGAIPPLIAARIMANHASIWIGVMLAVLAAVSVGATVRIAETRGRDIRA